MRETTLYEGLKMTYVSQATDPRDTIFGILVILGVNRKYPDIVPEYSISMRDCVIGIMGHILLTSQEIWPLLVASGANTRPQYPSWVPNLESRESWTQIPVSNPRDVEQMKALSGTWDTVVGLEGYDYRSIYPVPSNLEGHSGITMKYLDHLLIGCWIPWHHGASIDSDSGALTLRLVRLFATPHTIVEESHGSPRDDIDCHLCVKGPSASAYFASTKKPPGRKKPYHMFLAFGNGGIGLLMEDRNIRSRKLPPAVDMCLLLADEAEAPGTFKLVSCCRLADAILLSASPTRPQPSQLLPREPYGRLTVLSLYGNLYNISHYDARKHFQPDFGSDARVFNMIIPERGGDAPDFLQLALAAARTGKSATVTEDFRRAYAGVLQSSPTEFNPILDDKYVWFTMADDHVLGRFWDSLSRYFSEEKSTNRPLHWLKWKDFFPRWFDLQIPGVGTSFGDWECRKTEKNCERHQDLNCRGHPKLHYWLPCAAERAGLQMPVRAKMPLKEIVEAMLGTRLGRLLTQLLAFSEKVSEDAETLLARGPRPEDSNIYLSEWPQSLVDELGFVWRSEMVTFV